MSYRTNLCAATQRPLLPAFKTPEPRHFEQLSLLDQPNKR